MSCVAEHVQTELWCQSKCTVIWHHSAFLKKKFNIVKTHMISLKAKSYYIESVEKVYTISERLINSYSIADNTESILDKML